MTIKKEVVWTFDCDWPECSSRLRVHRTHQREALALARDRDWSVSHVGPHHGYEGTQITCRCPDHSYKWPKDQVGRPRRRLGQITTLPPVRHGKCTGCKQRPHPETGACKCGSMTMPLGET